MPTLRTALVSAVKPLTILLALAFVLISTASATEPDKVQRNKASYDASELKKNLTASRGIVTSQETEKVSFEVIVDKDGEVKDLTYKHTITTKKENVVDAFITKAYQAILNTTFYPARKDGLGVEDTVKIDVQMIN